ncbi:hypothetical protein R3P38DRAFT_2830722 [Favolaschia claudopus]|uniref:DUF7719 domain-containing protein n=1 Tax=Favolaschia claudopus TaxID=2862362 RepID=A0AAW0EDM2_9AGAR
MPPRQTTKTSKKSAKMVEDEIPESEQWRLINESGILKTAALNEPASSEHPELSLAEEIFDATLLIIPCSFLLLLMQILIMNQYGQDANLKVLIGRMVEGLPILSLFIFFTTRHKRNPRVQILLFIMGSAAGCRMLYLLKRGGYLSNMRQCPPLITLWVYTVIQLDLGFAVLNLILVALFVWWKELDLFN